MGFEIFRSDICSWEAQEFGPMHTEIVLSSLPITHEIGRTGDSKKVRGREVHIGSQKEFKHLHRRPVPGRRTHDRKEPIKQEHPRKRPEVLRVLQVRFGVHVRNHALLLRMRLVLPGAEQIRHSVIPKLPEIPRILFIAADIDLTEAIEGRHAQLIGAKTHHRATLLVCSIDRAGFEARATFPPHPCWEKRGGEVGIGDFGERGEEGGDEDVLVD